MLGKNKNILLIGGAGYIGLVISKILLKKNYNVICLDNLIYNQERPDSCIYHKNYKFINCDIRNLDKLKLIISNINHVLILAGLVGDPITQRYPELSEKINLRAIQNLFLFLNNKNIEKLIFISTCSNYGLLNNNDVANEEYELKPLSLYAKHKVANEEFLISLKSKVDYCPTILRFSTAFGLSDRMRFDLTINQFTLQLANKNVIEVYDKDTWRPYCHVKDFAILIDKVLNASEDKVSFEIFNAGSTSNNATKLDIINKINYVLPDINVKFVDGGSDQRNYKVDFSKVSSVLGFNAIYDIDYGIKEIIEANKQKLFNDFLAKSNKYGNYTIEE